MAKKMSRFADRGKVAEKAVQGYLEGWQARDPHREFNRLPDTKAAGRTIKAAPADFDYYAIDKDGRAFFGLIEVKETQHDYRLDRSKITQLPAMRKRAKCGGTCPVLIYHSTIDRWRVVLAPAFMTFGDKGSWNLTDYPTYASAGDALHDLVKTVFE